MTRTLALVLVLAAGCARPDPRTGLLARDARVVVCGEVSRWQSSVARVPTSTGYLSLPADCPLRVVSDPGPESDPDREVLVQIEARSYRGRGAIARKEVRPAPR